MSDAFVMAVEEELNGGACTDTDEADFDACWFITVKFIVYDTPARRVDPGTTVRDPLPTSQLAWPEIAAGSDDVSCTVVDPVRFVMPLSPVMEMLVVAVVSVEPDRVRHVVYKGTLLDRVTVRVFWSQGK